MFRHHSFSKVSLQYPEEITFLILKIFFKSKMYTDSFLSSFSKFFFQFEHFFFSFLKIFFNP